MGKCPIFKMKMSWYRRHSLWSVWRNSGGERVKNLRKLGCDISSDHIEACHRVGRTTDTVIVKFSKRKDCQHIWSVKKDLMKLTLEDSELPGNNKLSISHIINCCSLKARNFIASVNNSFGKHFPDVDLSPPSRTS